MTTPAWMLNDLVNLPGVRHAIVLTADGLVDVHSAGIPRDAADKFAAALAGLQSLSRSTAEFCADSPHAPWQQTLVEFDTGYLLTTAAGTGSYLAVSCTSDVDLPMISHRLHQLVDRLGREMTNPPRNGTAPRP
ncbi:roadblock/LC7 domain-containing protein [Planomonospora parontospora]|uniref:roadblock/LC7 domain-containing protein n=1 Tax=Planomonospora parontospora TaxID=58119 RepID=UPI00167004CC|nr:roadblock/LC7 domain-containing protein [Planomonospora parontospora]GGL41113.1 dynein regulation protein LC7 [Planomonospora parontospora subsp. antibiotica]GII17929.1 dynein regulation protein LC7 [Planomonospora parontospora subsp. antibiotica]